MTDREFRVVTHKTWLAEKFKPFGAVHDWGWDINPDTAQETMWWAPGAWVASAFKAGVPLPLTSCGPRWLDNLPYKFRGRDVRTMSFMNCVYYGQGVVEDQHLPPEAETEIFVKLPEAKIDDFPARIHKYNRHWSATMAQYALPPETLVQCQEPIEFYDEARFWIAHGEVVADSYYKIRDNLGTLIWGDDKFDEQSSWGEYRQKLAAMRLYVKQLLKEVDVAPGCVIDVGLDILGRAFVVEANAAWSSGPYNGDPEGIMAAIEASHDWEFEHTRWTWVPNIVLHKAGPLKVVRS